MRLCRGEDQRRGENHDNRERECKTRAGNCSLDPGDEPVVDVDDDLHGRAPGCVTYLQDSMGNKIYTSCTLVKLKSGPGRLFYLHVR